MLDLRLRTVAEFTGEGLLTCLCVYDGTCYVGCEDGDAGLYTVGASGFTAVTLPLSSTADAAYVQELVEWDDELWALGWQVALDAEGEVEAAVPCAWGYDGSAWTLRGLLPAASEALRWCNAAVGSERLHGGAYDLSTSGGAGAWEATGIDGSLEVDDDREVRAVAMLGDTPVRIWRETPGAAWRLEDVEGLTPHVGATARWGYTGHPLQPLATWQGRVWTTTVAGGRQQLHSTRGETARPGPSWLVEALGEYDVLAVFKNRLVLFGVDADGLPVYALWDPPGVALAREAGSWRVRQARAYDGDLWALGSQGERVAATEGDEPFHVVRRGTSPPGEFFPIHGSLRYVPDWQASPYQVTSDMTGDGWLVLDGYGGSSGFYVRGGTYQGKPYWVRSGGSRYVVYEWTRNEAARQAVLLVGGEVRAYSLEVQWGDGLGANVPTLSSVSAQWSREYPTEVTLVSLTAEWGDGLGANTPTLLSLSAHWGDGRALAQPTVEAVEVGWGKGGDARPGLTSLQAQWGDGLGGNKPTLLSLSAQWQVPVVGLKRPRIESVTLEHGDGSGDNTPTLLSLSAHWGDGLGANSPVLASVAAHWSVGWLAARPELASVAAHWSDHGPYPPRSAARVSMVKVEWNDDADPTAAGEDILWLTHTADAPVVGVRVVTSAVMEEGRDLQCLIRTDDSPDVDAWHTYQKFLSNRTVVVEEPGTDLRIGIAKDASVADETDVFVQFKFDE